MRRREASLALAATPMLWAALEALKTGSDTKAWRALAQDPALAHGALLTLWTGLASTLLAWWGAAALLSRGFVRQRLTRLLRGIMAGMTPDGEILPMVKPQFEVGRDRVGRGGDGRRGGAPSFFCGRRPAGSGAQ